MSKIINNTSDNISNNGNYEVFYEKHFGKVIKYFYYLLRIWKMVHIKIFISKDRQIEKPECFIFNIYQ